jgi:hypothetical protein
MQRNEYPHTVFLVCGTQAEKADHNSVMLVKMSNLTKTLKVSMPGDNTLTDEHARILLST